MNNKKIAVVTGAAGFTGFSLTMHLLMHGYKVYALVRPNSEHNNRLSAENVFQLIKKHSNKFGGRTISVKDIDESLSVLELDCNEYALLDKKIKDKCDILFHLAWQGGRDDFYAQNENITYTIEILEASSRIGCSRFVCTGSQAEYGVKKEVIRENEIPCPINAYGTAKLAAMYLSKCRAEQLQIEWVWGRIFSLYGLYEPRGRMLPDLISKMKSGEKINLSDCTQNWDYLDVNDAAEAIISLGEKGYPGEIYNIANGDYKMLKDYVEIVEKKYSDKANLIQFGDRANPYISLSPSVEKINEHTGWSAKVSFLELL